jgi:probable phosphoglycerate mutase
VTTTFYLIRHGAHDWLGKGIAGRLPGVSLNAAGRAQSDRLADRLAGVPFAAIYASPLERAQETAAPLAARRGLTVETLNDIHEMNFGDWTGKTFAELDAEPLWRPFNTFRSGTRLPGGGETMAEAQLRMVTGMERLRARHPDASVALVGHGDPIRAAVAYFLGVPLDLCARIEIESASVSVAALADWGPRVLRVNDTGGG